MMVPLVVCTCIIGGREPLRPLAFAPETPHVLFTEQAVSLAGWDVRRPVRIQAHAGLTAAWHKLHVAELFPDAAAVLWLDGNIQPRGDLAPWAGTRLTTAPLGVYLHHRDRTTAQAVEGAIRNRLDEPQVLYQQLRLQQLSGFRDDCFFTTSVVLYRPSPALAQLVEVWWDWVAHGSWRDDLSLPYALWRTGMSPSLLGDTSAAARTDLFTVHPHDAICLPYYG